MPFEEHKKLKTMAAFMGVSLKDLVLNCLRDHLLSDNEPNDETLKAFKETDEGKVNGPICISFMKDTEHALVDPYRWRTLPLVQKEILRLTNPFTTTLIENYPELTAGFGSVPNLSPTVLPVVKSLVITSSRSTKKWQQAHQQRTHQIDSSFSTALL